MKKSVLAAIIAVVAMPAIASQPQSQAPAKAQVKVTPAKAAPGKAGAPGQDQGPRVLYTLRGKLTLYQMGSYNGDRWVVDTASRVVQTRWPIKSLSIHPGDRWQICARPSFRDCIILDRSVPDASVVGIANQIGSARPAPKDAK